MEPVAMMSEEEWMNDETPEGFGVVETEEGTFPLKAMDIRAHVVGVVACTKISQTFVNSYAAVLEATYIFPLPPGGAVRNFRVRIADREIEGVLRERGEARQQYEAAIQAGHRASIVEEERPDVFTLRVGNVEPGEHVVVTFDVTETLPVSDGEATFRFPLVVAQRYVPGTPLSGPQVGTGISPDTDVVPDASRISPPVLLSGMPNPVSLALSVTVSGLGATNLRSSLHSVREHRGRTQTVSLGANEKLDRDFILRWDVELGESFLIQQDLEGEGGTFALTLTPEAVANEKPRDVVFVLDRSGSMGGWKMVAARRALGRMVDSLTEKDRFAVIAFDTSIDRFRNSTELVEASNRNRYRAVEWLSKIDARGGTEILQPVVEAVQAVGEGYADRARSVVLVTDGQVANEREIITQVAPAIGTTKIHTIGIDDAVNGGFLNALARVGSGVCELVESENRLDEAMDRVHRNIGHAVLSELSLAFDGIDVDENSLPARLPDVFSGIATVIMGRYRRCDAEPSVRLAARQADGNSFSVRQLGTVETGEQFRPVWARRHIQMLDDRFQIEPSNKARLEKELVATSLAHGVLSRFTAFVAIDHEHVIDSDLPKVEVTQPVEMVGGSASYGGNVMPGAPMAASAPAPMPRRRSAPKGKSRGESMMKKESAPIDKFVLGEFEAAMDYDDYEEEGGDELHTVSQSYTQSGIVKPIEMSPEVALGKPFDLGRAMVFILGCWLFRAVTGRRLFDGTQFEMLRDLVAWDPANLSADEVGDWYDILHRALQVSPDDRYASPAAFAEAIRVQQSKPEKLDGNYADILRRGGEGSITATQKVATIASNVDSLDDFYPGFFEISDAGATSDSDSRTDFWK